MVSSTSSTTRLNNVDLMGVTISTQQGTHSPLVAFLSLKKKSLEFLKDLSSAFILKTVLIFLDIQVSSLILSPHSPIISMYFPHVISYIKMKNDPLKYTVH